ncbi:hypothetical protein N657DRAFT_355166 [Parathielavia appendiculata]|uniref:Uncharacterized protein n=1 Tax=Parathielavia appendiculata TaxID=2587402 RepID=A0AAN6U3G9_9PEZI|nr:hypothetical protein N657DRAFT_355166 [Parathielavia appendiculata]
MRVKPPQIYRVAAKGRAPRTRAASTTPARKPTPRPSPSSSPRPPNPSAAPSVADIAALKAETAQKWRRIILTVAFASVTITGTIYGAGLKTQQEWKAEKQKVQEAGADEKIAILSQHKADLERQRGEIEGKLAELRARIKANVEPGGGSGTT